MSAVPVKADVYLTYVCPKCCIQHVLKRAETEIGSITCVCNHKFRINPIKSIDIIPLYSESRDKNFVASPKLCDIINEAAEELKKLGIARCRSMPKIRRMIRHKAYQNSESIVKDFL